MMKSQAPELSRIDALARQQFIRQYIENPEHSAWHLESVQWIVATSFVIST